MYARDRALQCVPRPSWPDRSGPVSATSNPFRARLVSHFRSFSKRVVNDLLQRYLNVHAPRWGVFHQNEKHVLGAVDHKIDAGGAVPFDLAERARRRRHRVAGIGADAEAIAKSETVAGVIEIVARDPRPRPDMIRCHRGERSRAKISFSVKRSAIQQHLRVARE